MPRSSPSGSWSRSPRAATTVTNGGDGGGGSSELTVLGAASLTDVFEELGATFEADNDADVTFSFGSSTDLAEQVADGAPGDVLATADETSMTVAEDAGVTGDVETFATNVLVIVTPPDNPAGIQSLDDLADATWVRCADEVPCGRVALGVLEDNGVTAEPASLEEDVRATLDKVVSGEADAGLVYATDAVAAGDSVNTIEIPGAESQLTSYFMTTLEQSEDSDLAQEWVDLVLSDEGRQALEEAGIRIAVSRDPLGRAPILILVPAALAVVVLVLPLVVMVGSTDLPGLLDQLRTETAREALWLSVSTSTVAMLIALVLGLPLAWVLARTAVPRPEPAPCVDRRADGAAARGGGHRPAYGVRPQRRHRRAAARCDRLRVPLHDLGRRAGARLRRDAVRGDQHRGGAALRGQ